MYTFKVVAYEFWNIVSADGKGFLMDMLFII